MSLALKASPVVSGRDGARRDSAPLLEVEALALARGHFAAISHIETHLFEPLSVERIARHAGLSPSRFSRGFTRLQGESVMAYVRGRRLEAAMRRILTDPDVRLLDLAFDCGFDSQEAFTRAFARAFGWTPGRFRAEGGPGPLMRRRRSRSERPEIRQWIAELPEMRLAGLAMRFTPARFGEMGTLWRDVVTLAAPEIRRDSCYYGVFQKHYCEDGGFDFLAALETAPDRAAPDGFQVVALPARRYLVLRHVLRRGDMLPQMNAARELIWSTLLPQSGCAIADAPHFQVYPALITCDGGWIDHCFPLRE